MATARWTMASTLSRWRSLISGPINVFGSAGLPWRTLAKFRAISSTISSWCFLGTNSRDVSAQPWPAWVTMLNAANMAAAAKSASSSMITADLPPNSRKTRLTVWLAAAMILRPTAVDPVKVITSTSGLVVSASPTAGPEELSTFTTPGGMSVWLAINSPNASVISGVSGAPLSTTVHPAASAGASLASASWFG